ncbi:MAG: hypothetical protein LLG00_10030 [Planctomycetaceae bacterium]|nr:hypothetical protein [Planctomycetaceae bacterium]
MSVINSVRWAVRVGLFVTMLPSALHAEPTAVKLRYGFKPDKEYVYEVDIHAKAMDQKIDSRGELIYKVLSANDDQAVLRTSGSAGHFAITEHMPFPRMGPRFMRHAPNGTTVSRRGAVLISGELTHLPLLLGDLETLVLDEFPEDAKKTWDKQRELVIEETESAGHFGRGFGPPIRLGPVTTTQYTAKELATFTITEATDELVRLNKKYSLKSGEKDKAARFDMSGSGQIEFDRKEGMIKKSSMTYEFKMNESGLSVTIPVTVTSRLYSASEWAEIKRKRDEAAKVAKAAAEEAARPKPFKTDERNRLIEQLASSEDRTVIAACDRLAKAIRDDRPDDFAKPLALLLASPNAWLQAAAARAMVVWATAESEEPLVQLVKVDNFMYCQPAIAALATLKTEKAAEAVASQMHRYRSEAGKALKSMGPVAEAATIALLKNQEFWMRRETAGVLAEIGGEDALRALQALDVGRHPQEGRDVQQAIFRIQRRLATQPKDTVSRHEAKKSTSSAAKEPSKPAAAAGEMRTWRDASGRFEIEATLVAVKDGKVTLKKKDGRTIRVLLKKLSDEDRKHIESQSESAFGEGAE